MNSIDVGETSNQAGEPALQDSERIKKSIMVKLLAEETDFFPDGSTDQNSDNALISSDYKVYDRRVSEGDRTAREAEEYLNELQRLLEEWTPSPDLTLTEELLLLKTQYEQILWKLLEYYNQSETEWLTAMLDHLLIQLLLQIETAKFPSLQFLIDHFGEQDIDLSIKTALFRILTGRTITPGELIKNTAGKTDYQPELRKESAAEHHFTSKTSAKYTAADNSENSLFRSFTEKTVNKNLLRQEGLLYCRSSHNTVVTDKIYHKNLRLAEQQSLRQECRAGGKLQAANMAESIGKVECFLEYMEPEGSLMNSFSFSALNEELTGFLMAEAMIKTQIFVKCSAVESSLGNGLIKVMDQFLHYTLGEALRKCQTFEGNSVTHQLRQKEVWHSYHAVISYFYKWKNPQEALSKGFAYVLQRFTSKKSTEEYKHFKRYGENAGFFKNTISDKEMQKEIGLGTCALEQDWKNYLAAIGQKHNKRLSLALNYSPWGELLETEKPLRHQTAISPAAVFITFCFMAAILFLIIRM